MSDYGSKGCYDWADGTKSRPNGQGTQTEGGSADNASDPERAAPNYDNIPFDGKAASVSRQEQPGYPDLFQP